MESENLIQMPAGHTNTGSAARRRWTPLVTPTKRGSTFPDGFLTHTQTTVWWFNVSTHPPLKLKKNYSLVIQASLIYAVSNTERILFMNCHLKK